MGMSAARAKKGEGLRPGLLIVWVLAMLLCGVAAVGLSAAMVAALARAGWNDIIWVLTATGDPGVGDALMWSGVLLGLALPIASTVAFFAAVAASDAEIGGRAGSLVRSSLRLGPATPSIAVGVALLALVTSDPRLEQFVRAHPIVAAAAAILALNVPIMTARFRAVLGSVPAEWRTAAIAAGASPATALTRVILPRATAGIVATILHGAGQVIGETAAIAIVLSVGTGVRLVNHALTFDKVPLSVHLWQRLALGHPDPAFAAAAASETLTLVAAVVMLRFVARVLQRRRRVGVA